MLKIMLAHSVQVGISYSPPHQKYSLTSIHQSSFQCFTFKTNPTALFRCLSKYLSNSFEAKMFQYQTSTPKNKYTPPPPKQRGSKRHHRTATPEQRQIRAYTNAPIYTLGIDPQNDRGLLCDFFEAIKTWASSYTVPIRSLTAERIHNLAAHPAITLCLGTQPPSIATEKHMLIAMVAAVVSRYIFLTTIDEHALQLSNHPHANLTEHLAREWILLRDTAPAQKDEALRRQRDVYTAIKNAPGHKEWRTRCAQGFANSLLRDLDGLLAINLPVAVAAERNHILQELFVKGYRISFRLRMASQRWDFCWPGAGAEFDAKMMVNESRLLYGDVLATMQQLLAAPGEHVVRFGVSPVVVKREWGVGGERREVVHSSLVHVTRRGWE